MDSTPLAQEHQHHSTPTTDADTLHIGGKPVPYSTQALLNAVAVAAAAVNQDRSAAVAREKCRSPLGESDVETASQLSSDDEPVPSAQRNTLQSLAAPGIVDQSSSTLALFNIANAGRSNRARRAAAGRKASLRASSSAPTPTEASGPSAAPEPATASNAGPVRVARPFNSFILYRMDKQKQIVSKQPGLNHKIVSCLVADAWRQEPEAVKDIYRAKAEQYKRNHREMYPDWKLVRRSKRRQPASAAEPQVGSSDRAVQGSSPAAAPAASVPAVTTVPTMTRALAALAAHVMAAPPPATRGGTTTTVTQPAYFFTPPTAVLRSGDRDGVDQSEKTTVAPVAVPLPPAHALIASQGHHYRVAQPAGAGAAPYGTVYAIYPSPGPQQPAQVQAFYTPAPEPRAAPRGALDATSAFPAASQQLHLVAGAPAGPVYFVTPSTSAPPAASRIAQVSPTATEGAAPYILALPVATAAASDERPGSAGAQGSTAAPRP